MKKLFGFIAIALAFVACSQLEETQIQPDANEGIVINAQLAPKTAITKAVADKGDNKITVTWAENEHIAILYEAGGSKKMADAIVKSVDGSGAAQISFTVDAATTDGTACTIVYPLSAAKGDYTGVKDAATLLGTQDGTLNANLDVRVGEGTIQITTPGLTVTTQPVPQFAIFRFMAESSLTGLPIKKISSFKVTTGGQDYIITPGTAQQMVYAALPPVTNAEIVFSAVGKYTGDDAEKTFNRTRRSVTFVAGKLYTSTIKMISATLNENLDSFDTKTSGVDYFGSTVKCIGSSAADGVGLQISQGKNIYISTLSGQIITRVEFHSSAGLSEASLTSSTRGLVNWKNGAENGSIEGINATNFTISNSSSDPVKIDHFVVYFISGPSNHETISINTGATSYSGTHFSVWGTTGDLNGLRIDAQGGQKSINIQSNYGEAISKVEFHSTNGKTVAESTKSTKGVVNWANGEDNGTIIGVNSTGLEITNSNTSILVQISSVTVYYYTETE
jgi:hypothetical protein